MTRRKFYALALPADRPVSTTEADFTPLDFCRIIRKKIGFFGLIKTGDIKTRSLTANQTGFTLVEVIVSMAIVVSCLLSTYNLIAQALKITQENKLKLSATMLANQKLERIRNLPYDSIGTVHGIPIGVVEDDEISTSSAGNFDVNTVIQYKDDPFDGIASGTPDDLLPADYKLIRVRVGWLGAYGYRTAVVWTTIAPQGTETTPDGGTLVITVQNALGQAIEAADVHVVNNLLAPTIDTNFQTAANGSVVISGAPASIEGYEITVSKAGYSTSSTTARTVANPNPTLVNATVLADEKTEVFFAIDLLSTLVIHTFHQDLPENWQINNDASGANQTNSRIALDAAGNTYVVWQDYRHGSEAKIYAQKYNAAKVAQWAGDKVIGASDKQILPDVLVDSPNNALYIAWSDDASTPGNQESYLVKLNTSDGSDAVGWGGSTKIVSAPNDQIRVRIALSGGNDLTAVWQDNRAGNQDIYTKRYNPDKSVAWAEFKVNSDAGTANQTYPAVVTDGTDYTYVSWTDDRNGNQDIYLQSLDSTGNKRWASDLLVTNSAASQYASNLAVDSSNNVYVAWSDQRNGNWDAYVQKFDASGTPLWASDLKVNSDAGVANQYTPAIAVNASNEIFIVWTDERNGNQDIYAQKLDTAGNRLWTSDTRVNMNTDASAQYNPDVTINPVNGKPVATWQDDRNANFDIYATEFDTYGTRTDIPNLSLHLTSAKRVGENPIIYKFVSDYTTDGSGYVTLNNLEWDDYTITINPPSTKTIIMADPPIPVNVLPNTTQNSDLYLD